MIGLIFKTRTNYVFTRLKHMIDRIQLVVTVKCDTHDITVDFYVP